MDQEFSLKGEVALVTGSGRGLGHAIAVRLAELGADVAIHDHQGTAPAEYGEFADMDGLARRDRASRHEHLRRARQHCRSGRRRRDGPHGRVSKLGPVSILVNAAGGDIGAGGGKPNPNNALDIKLEDIRALLDRNLIGTMLMCQAVVPRHARRAAAAPSSTSRRPPAISARRRRWRTRRSRRRSCTTRDASPSKRGDHHVRVNCVSPGATATARFLQHPRDRCRRCWSRMGPSSATAHPATRRTRWRFCARQPRSSSTDRCCASTAGGRSSRVKV